ncbi:hypothetical protein Anas_07548 [Armadillidium nasatum]|uniref:Uncharacterized protein n=1 Tax=Armadillidium nasatum TaxID=96803 RepID=A0A5N5TDJ2_9CRUS|nr:hypothetical protein Anas_07548 [Armadillidium nasatum]
MSTSYPKVHVVGSGAYYSYRPITKYIEKADRNYIRDASSRPNDFGKYLSATSSRAPGFTRASVDKDRNRDRDFFRGSSLPPFDTGRKII